MPLDALAELDDAGVILRVRAGRLQHLDVAELRIRTQQLAALDGRTGRELARFRDAEERVGAPVRACNCRPSPGTSDRAG